MFKLLGVVVLVAVVAIGIDMYRNGTKTVTVENGKTTTVYSYHTTW